MLNFAGMFDAERFGGPVAALIHELVLTPHWERKVHGRRAD